MLRPILSFSLAAGILLAGVPAVISTAPATASSSESGLVAGGHHKGGKHKGKHKHGRHKSGKHAKKQ